MRNRGIYWCNEARKAFSSRRVSLEICTSFSKNSVGGGMLQRYIPQEYNPWANTGDCVAFGDKIVPSYLNVYQIHWAPTFLIVSSHSLMGFNLSHLVPLSNERNKTLPRRKPSQSSCSKTHQSPGRIVVLWTHPFWLSCDPDAVVCCRTRIDRSLLCFLTSLSNNQTTELF